MEPVTRGSEGGVVDRGSGVKFRSCIDVDVEDVVEGEDIDEDSVDIDNNVTGQGGEPVSVMYLSPMKTIHTTHTVVGSNQMTVLTVEEPKVGMVFRSWEEIEAYYKEYAEQKGFGVTRVQGVNCKKDKTKRIATTWKCECWGRPDMRAMREAKKRAKAMGVGGTGGLVEGVVCEDELSRAKRTSKKCECLARIYASINENGAWELKTVHLEHNHLVDPAQAKLVKDYRRKHITSKVKKRLMDYYEQGVPISQIHGCMATERNGVENMPFTVKDLQHEVYKARRLKMVGGDAVAMMEFFGKMQSDNQNFFHAQRLDEEGRLKDVLWVDARSRVAYEDFGDVVCFDTTYLTNEYEFPFANFVGVNHHGQTLLLGCALISHEDCDTFEWVFRQWVACMNNRAPRSILTDQAAAMRRPLAKVMPNTIHRWCIWHIMSKIPDKLGKCSRYQEFVNPLKEVVYESFTPDEFHDRWAELIFEYKLENNEWLQSLHKESFMWVPAYMKEFFWAGMKTTQRVESIHRFFDGYVNRKTKLHEFPQKYCMALDKRIQDEVSADDRCSKYLRRLVSGFKVEKIFQKLYTDSKFQEVQKECSRLMYCSVRGETVISESLIQYLVVDRVWIVPPGASEDVMTNRRRLLNVSYYPITKEVQCECRMFETHGILCKHSIRILDENEVEDLPEKYIVSRWRKDIARKHTRVKVANHDPRDTDHVKRFDMMMKKFEPLCEAAAMVNNETAQMVIEALSKLEAAVNECGNKKRQENVPIVSTLSSEVEGTSSVQNQNHTQPEQETCPPSMDPIKDPVIKKRKRGRPKASRHKTNAETGYKNSTSKKKSKHDFEGDDAIATDKDQDQGANGKNTKSKKAISQDDEPTSNDKGKGRKATTTKANHAKGKSQGQTTATNATKGQTKPKGQNVVKSQTKAKRQNAAKGQTKAKGQNEAKGQNASKGKVKQKRLDELLG